jgi:nicotinamide-nucleotide amidase
VTSKEQLLKRFSEAEMIIIGDELLNGLRRDSHLAHVGRSLSHLGVRLNAGHVVGDTRRGIAELIARRLHETRVLIISGGLGPTADDVTREATADALDLPLEFREDQWQEVQGIFQRTGRTASSLNRKQAHFPRGAIPIANPNGTAPGFYIESKGCFIAVLPGPPIELIPMMEDAILPCIQAVFRREEIFRATFRTTGIGESNLIPLVTPVFERFQEFALSSLPHVAGVDLVITAKDVTADRASMEKRASALGTELRRLLGSKLYARGRASLEAVIGQELARRGETLSIAESLTGGHVGKTITDVAGSSGYFLCDIVAYSNDAKVTFLGVSDDSLRKHGAVSEQVCLEMAEGIRNRTGSTYGLATTGIAGPTGGSTAKPVGLCYYGLSWSGGSTVRHRIFAGDRSDVRVRVCWAALHHLFDTIYRTEGNAR